MRRLLTIAAVALLAGSVARAHAEDRVTSQMPKTPAAQSTASPEFRAVGAVAALTLLLGGVAVLKGWRRE